MKEQETIRMLEVLITWLAGPQRYLTLDAGLAHISEGIDPLKATEWAGFGFHDPDMFKHLLPVELIAHGTLDGKTDIFERCSFRAGRRVAFYSLDNLERTKQAWSKLLERRFDLMGGDIHQGYLVPSLYALAQLGDVRYIRFTGIKRSSSLHRVEEQFDRRLIDREAQPELEPVLRAMVQHFLDEARRLEGVKL